MAKRKYRRSIINKKKGKVSIQTLVIVALIIGCIKLGQELSSRENNGGVTRTGIENAGDYGDLMAVKTNEKSVSVEKKYKGMDISFNPKYHIPNWVSWELTEEETKGDVNRTNKFSSDEDVAGCADTWDYNYSGYDRGHMAPAGDMKWDKDAMEETFLMTNICPQVNSLDTRQLETS